MKKTLVLLTLAFAGNVSAATFMPWTDLMRKADTNHDGGVSITEAKSRDIASEAPGFAPWFADHFAELDSNSDGMVDADELMKMIADQRLTDKEMTNALYKDHGFMPTNPANR